MFNISIEFIYIRYKIFIAVYRMLNSYWISCVIVLLLSSVNGTNEKCFCHDLIRNFFKVKLNQTIEVTSFQFNLDDTSYFIQLSGQIDDCFCDIETLEKFNNEEIYPLIQKLINRDFFRYYKVNLFKECKYFDDIGTCENEACGVIPCSEDELPVGLRSGNGVGVSSLDKEDCERDRKSIGDVNGTLSNLTMNLLDSWDKHDEIVNPFCDVDDEISANSQYVDLVTNPERYTGYKGPMAWRIWKAIYEENCFMPETRKRKPRSIFDHFPQQGGNAPLLSDSDLQGLCLEKRVFYRVISGLHTSINTHLCVRYLFIDGWGERRWEPNLSEFQRRFDPATTKGEGTSRLKNLYFIYLLELRALSKVTSYFKRSNVVLYTGKPKHDERTKEMVVNLLEKTKEFPMQFNEDLMFQDKNAHSLKTEFAERFLNVTRIIDCVTCEKCRLWGKLQTQGLGTALKILFSGREIESDVTPSFKLVRQEVTSLINAFARLSSSIKSLEIFRDLMMDEKSHVKNDEL